MIVYFSIRVSVLLQPSPSARARQQGMLDRGMLLGRRLHLQPCGVARARPRRCDPPIRRQIRSHAIQIGGRLGDGRRAVLVELEPNILQRILCIGGIAETCREQAQQHRPFRQEHRLETGLGHR